MEGGGIKTKMVEALGYDTMVVSTSNGSIGVTEAETGGRLKIIPDDDWSSFAMKMIEVASEHTVHIPDSFYNKFYWGNIAKKAEAFIRSPL